MYKNYFFLNRLIVEINSILNNSILLSAFSQEKDKLVLEIKNDGGIIFLEISVNPGFPYINFKDSYHRAKKNTVDFFEEFLPLKLLYLEIAAEDRILKIKSESNSIYFAIRGKYTNVHFHSNNNNFSSFKAPPNDFDRYEFIKEMESVIFINKLNTLQFQLTDIYDTWKELKTKYPIVGNDIISEVKSRIYRENKEEIAEQLSKVVNEIFYEKPTLFVDWKSLQVYLGISSFNIFPYSEKIFFEDLINALNSFISKKLYFEHFSGKKKKIQKYLDKELSHLSSKLNKLKGILEKGSKENEYQRLGNLLLINISLIHKGMNSIDLEDIYNENKRISIKLNETLSPKKNIDSYFDKAKNDHIKYEKSQELFNVTSKKYLHLKIIEKRFEEALEPEDYITIMKELNIKEESNKHYDYEIQNKFKHYLIENKYNVYVGRDSKNNDLLTTKFAKQNDYWFHARGVPGSHLVLRVDNTKEDIPKNILKKAASLAAFHSKAKTAGTVPVSFTLKKYVVKKKGMEAGKVALLREETLLVKPGIPDKCEYISKDY